MQLTYSCSLCLFNLDFHNTDRNHLLLHSPCHTVSLGYFWDIYDVYDMKKSLKCSILGGSDVNYQLSFPSFSPLDTVVFSILPFNSSLLKYLILSYYRVYKRALGFITETLSAHTPEFWVTLNCQFCKYFTALVFLHVFENFGISRHSYWWDL